MRRFNGNAHGRRPADDTSPVGWVGVLGEGSSLTDRSSDHLNAVHRSSGHNNAVHRIGIRRAGPVLVPDAPGRTVVVQQVEKRLGIERLWPENTRTRPGAVARSVPSPPPGRPPSARPPPGSCTRASTSRCRPRGTGRPRSGSPSLPSPRTQVPAQVLPCILSPRVAGSGSSAAITSRGETVTEPTWIFARGVDAELVLQLEHLDELLAEAVLEGDPLGVDPPRDQQHLLVFHVDALHRPDALRETRTPRARRTAPW